MVSKMATGNANGGDGEDGEDGLQNVHFTQAEARYKRIPRTRKERLGPWESRWGYVSFEGEGDSEGLTLCALHALARRRSTCALGQWSECVQGPANLRTAAEATMHADRGSKSGIKL